MEAKQVIVVRKDLNMRKGKIAAQVAHASLGAFLKSCVVKEPRSSNRGLTVTGEFKEGTPMNNWLTGPFTKVCVGCDSEVELLTLVENAKSKGILHCLITDSGKTEFNGVPTITCAAFGPEWIDELDKLTGHLKLL